MRLPLYIAKRYLFSKKKHNAINVISGVSVCGVILATVAMICTLSVFNGFQEMMEQLFTSFDPDLKISAREGKVFDATAPAVAGVRKMAEVEVFTETLEENAMVQYRDRQAMATIKGVEDNFEQLTAIDSILYGAGEFMLHDSIVDYAVMGGDLVGTLGTGLMFVDPLQIYVPKRNERVNMSNPATSFNTDYLFSPGVIFVVNQQKYDSQYILTSLSFVRRLLDYDTEVSAVELKLKPGTNVDDFQRRLEQQLGSDYLVLNRYEQQADVFRIVSVEKFVSYLFLTFILVVACFNVIGSLSMLMLDKRDDIVTLRRLGADSRLIGRIFLFEGAMISVCGALIGIVIGLALCYAQQRYGFITLGNGGNFVVDAYPVSVRLMDVLVIIVTVIVVSFASVWYPVRYLTRRLK
jgi:lipoprotein-releasing system permease protein